MTAPAERPQQGPSLEDEGIPDHEGPLRDKERTGDAQEGHAPPGDTPAAADQHGVTAGEQREGESTDAKLARETPEADADQAEAQMEASGRLVEPDAGTGRDDEDEAVADETDDVALSAEEESIRRGDPRR